MFEEYAKSAYSTMTQKGSTVIPYSNRADLFNKLRQTLSKETAPSYFFVYWSHVDSIEHVFGPRSKEHLLALSQLSNLLLHELSKLDKKTMQDIAFMLTSDHGQSSINGEDIIYLNTYLKLEDSYLRSPSLRSIHPTGSPHDVFLYIYPPKIPQTLKLLETNLVGKAGVIPIKEAISRGLFGVNQLTERFLKRIGVVLILPYEGYHVWYKHAPTMHYAQKGRHGGLSQEEMIVPFSVGKLSDLFV